MKGNEDGRGRAEAAAAASSSKRLPRALRTFPIGAGAGANGSVGSGRKRESARRRAEISSRRVFPEVAEGILIIDGDTDVIVDVNPRLQSWLASAPGELIGKSLWSIALVADVSQNHEALQRLRLGSNRDVEPLVLYGCSVKGPWCDLACTAHVGNRGGRIWCHVREKTDAVSSAVRHNALVAELLRMVVDLQDRERYQCDLANHDALTGLYNRRFLDDVLAHEVSLAQRRQSSVSVAVLDIDGFKRFNDCFGHGAGDLALVECAKVLGANSRKSDIACRIGGDEFAIVLPDATPSESRPRLEQMCSIIEGHELEYDGKALGPVTVSVGVAGAPTDALNALGLLRCADAALYRAKDAGRNRVTVYAAPSLD